MQQSITARGLAAVPAATALVATLLAAVPGPSAAAEPPGCGTTSTQQPGTSVDHSLVSGGLERTYRVHLPEGYTPDESWPVVLVFHGRGNDAATTEEFSEMSDTPAVVVYPNGRVGTGDGERQAWQGAPYEPPGVDDLAFTEDLLDEVAATWCVDERRVYATGKSNGGGFANLLACRLADRIAATAPVAGAYYPGTRTGCAPDRAVPVLAIHGTGDATIPYAGDPDRELPAIRSHVQEWAVRDACRTGPRERRLADDVVSYRWDGCARGTQVQHLAVVGGGHTWPGADSYSGGGYVTQSIEGADVVWAFLRRHHLPAR